jgi:hypothetical protein
MSETIQLGDFRAACEEAIRGAQLRATQLAQSLEGVVLEPKGGPKTNRMPYGFDVDKGRRLLASEGALMKRMKDVAYNAAKSLDLCSVNELPVIGILPEDVWLKICAERQLFTLWVNREGQVTASTSSLRAAQVAAMRKVRERNFFGQRRSYDKLELLRARAQRKITKDFFERTNRVSMMLDVFPHFGQFVETHESDKVSVSFPEPPADFGKALLKLDGLGWKLAVVVEADAINIDSYVLETLAKIDESISELEGQRRHANREKFFTLADPDPILTFKYWERGHEEGPVRVIVAQYGEWPFELAAVKRAIEEDLTQTAG